MTSKFHHNAQKVEEKLKKSTAVEAQKSVGAYFITTKEELGTEYGCALHADIIDQFRDELDLVQSSEYFEIDSLSDFLIKTGMIRIRFDSDKVDLTINTNPNQSQINFLEKLPNYVSYIKYEIVFDEINLKNETTIEDFLVDIKKLKRRTIMNCKSLFHDCWILLFGECRKCHSDDYQSTIFYGGKLN